MATDGIIPGETMKGGPWARNNESKRGKIITDWERRKKGTKKDGKKGECWEKEDWKGRRE